MQELLEQVTDFCAQAPPGAELWLPKLDRGARKTIHRLCDELHLGHESENVAKDGRVLVIWKGEQKEPKRPRLTRTEAR